MENLKKLTEKYQTDVAGDGAAAAGQVEDDDDEVPELVAGETFEAAAAEERHATS